MKKFSFKKMGLPIALVIVIVLSSVVAVWTTKQTDSNMLKESDGASTKESTTLADEEPVTGVYTEIVEVVETSEKDNGEIVTVKTTEVETKVKVVNATEKKENKTTVEATEKASEEKTVAQTTVKKEESTTKKPVETQVIRETTTKKASTVETTKKEVATTKAPTTTKASKDEYYPALTQADIEEIKQYTIDYIKACGQPVRATLDWDRAGFSSIFTIPTDLSIRGDMYKINGGVDPVEWAKGRMKDKVDCHIETYERTNGKGSIAGLYPLVKLEDGYWNFTIGYC